MKTNNWVELPHTILLCHARIQELSTELNAAQALIEDLRGENRALLEKVRDLVHRVFGRKSERSVLRTFSQTPRPRMILPAMSLSWLRNRCQRRRSLPTRRSGLSRTP